MKGKKTFTLVILLSIAAISQLSAMDKLLKHPGSLLSGSNGNQPEGLNPGQTACVPDWQPARFQQNNMNVIAKLYLSGVLTTNANDAVGAFVGTECRGIGHPDPSVGGMIFLTISSNAQSGETVTFRSWNSTTCQECVLTETFPFVAQSESGTMANPFLFHCECGSSLSVSPASQNVSNTAGTTTFNISNTGCGTLNWTASDDAGWLTLNPSGGTGNGSFSAIFTENTSCETRTATITITATGASGSPGTVTVTQPGNGQVPAQPGAITGNISPCQGSSQIYSTAAVPGASSYKWTLPSGWSGNSTSGTITVTVGSTPGNICVAAINSCGSGAQRCQAVTVSTVPAQPGPVSGNTSPCQGRTETYSVAAVAGATSYTWTLPDGWSGISTTNSINLTIGPNGGTLSVKANNSCGSGTGSDLTITPFNLNNLSGPINGNLIVCQGSSQVYTTPAANGATGYKWVLPSDWTGSSTSNSISTTVGKLSGEISVQVITPCGTVTRQAVHVSVNTIPGQPGTITGNTFVCQGSSQTYSVTAVPGVTSYTWTLPSGWTGSSGSNTIETTAGSTSGNICVAAGNSDCMGDKQCIAVTLSTSVPKQPGKISSEGDFNKDAIVTYSVQPVSGALSYTWNLPQDWSGSSTTPTIVVKIGTTSGIITITANNACGSSTPYITPVYDTELSDMAVFPNPFNHSLHIQGSKVIKQVTMVNVAGQCVLDMKYPGEIVDTSHLGPGMYLINICTDNGLTGSYRLIKQ